MGKPGKHKRAGWSAPAWNDFKGKVWDAGDSDDARALVDEWVERALGVLQNMWFATSRPKVEQGPISKDAFVKDVDFIGEILAGHLNKPPNACKGLFIICVASQLGDDAMYLMKKEDLPAVINGSLKERLIALNIRNVNKIIQDILTKLATRDSI
ncbi:MAG: hypothetical protein Q6353_018310 [Candidatus Sigynarchaeum springense]